MPPDFGPLVTQYRAGLEAEMVILRQLEALAATQQEITSAAELGRLPSIIEERERLMAALVGIEHGLRPVRQQLAAARLQLGGEREFQELTALHRQAADLASTILTSDRASLHALQEAELARRAAAQALEQGESTLAAYRRVVAPAVTAPALVNRKG